MAAELVENMIKLVVFDWNGVIFSDLAATVSAANHVSKSFGGKPVNAEIFRDNFVIPVIQFYAKIGANEEALKKDPERWAHIFHTYYEERAKKCRSRGGAKETLSWLKENNVKAIILSNHTLEGIEFQLKRLKIREFFSDVLANSAKTASLTELNKEKKLEKYMKENRLKAGEAVIIGDTTEEVAIGKALGIQTIAITGGFHSTSRNDVLPHLKVGVSGCLEVC